MELLKPNLFIVGAPKCGTTFLYDTLGKHDGFFFPKVKELNHFSGGELDALGMYYKDFRIADKKAYLKMFSDSGAKYSIDSSVSYFAFENIPKKIHAFNPDSHIIIILRNPIQRAFSHYTMDTRMGHTKHSFITYITDSAKYPAHFHQYVNNSLYYRNIKNYLNVFGSTNVHVLILEKIKEQMEGLMDALDVPFHGKNIDATKKSNEHKESKNWIGRYAQKNRDVVSKLKMVVPKSLLNASKTLIYKDAPRVLIDAKSASIMMQIVSEDVEMLSNLLEKDMKEIWNL